jgi:two-component system, OmpR family, sensor histidine kinase ChvG
MSLRLQLLAFGLLTLVLPWTGFRYVQEMEASLRSGLERSMLASATTVAAALADQPALACAPSGCATGAPIEETLYAQPLAGEPRVDGGRDDWSLADGTERVLGAGLRLWTGIRGRYVYLFLAAEDRDVVYQRLPGQPPYGDRVVLFTRPDEVGERWLLLATAAPGTFRSQETQPIRFESTGRYDDRVVSAWEETTVGFSLEIRVPLALVGAALGVAVIDVDHGGADYAVSTHATWDLEAGSPGPLVYQRPELGRIVSQFSRTGGRFRVLDRDGWVLASAGSLNPAAALESVSGGLIDRLFRYALRRDDPPYPAEQPAGRIADATVRLALMGEPTAAWYAGGFEQEAIVAAAAPIGGNHAPLGAVVLEQASDSILTLTNQARVRLMMLTLAVSVAAALGLLGFATVLSLRVRRLAQAAETALGPKGEIRVALPGRGAQDEIGDLARSFENLLERLRGYTEYLRTLSSKLSHELRTPLAVISTSLDNLEHESHSSASDALLRRLRDGAQRLDAILVAMSEATRLEQAIKDTARETIDLHAVVESCCTAYADVYRSHEIAYRRTAQETRVTGSGELVAQLLDKLVDNAVSFAGAGSRIDVELGEAAERILLTVTNRGSTLPAPMRRQLFDSLVSVRDKSDGRPHLGLGLHVVALIAEFHGGGVAADDLPDRSGVVFTVWFPKRPR